MVTGGICSAVPVVDVKQSLEADVQEELNHVQMLGNRLKQLDERPPASADFEARQESLQPPEDSTDVVSVTDDACLEYL